MILIHVKQWLGPSRSILSSGCDYEEPEVTDESFMSTCGYVAALRRLRNYENAYNERYRNVKAVNFTVLSFCEFPEADSDVTVGELEDLTRANVIEFLPQAVEDFDR
jgi:hypothetical protein